MSNCPSGVVKQYLDARALDVWMKMNCSEVECKCDKGIFRIVDESGDVIEPIKLHADNKMTLTSFTETLRMSSITCTSQRTAKIIELCDKYGCIMRLGGHIESIWKVVQMLNTIRIDLGATVKRENIVSCFGPKNRPIYKVKITMKDNVELDLICTGSLPTLVVPYYRVLEQLILSPLDRKIVTDLVRR